MPWADARDIGDVAAARLLSRGRLPRHPADPPRRLIAEPGPAGDELEVARCGAAHDGDIARGVGAAHRDPGPLEPVPAVDPVPVGGPLAGPRNQTQP